MQIILLILLQKTTTAAITVTNTTDTTITTAAITRPKAFRTTTSCAICIYSTHRVYVEFVFVFEF